ncbi:DNA cytosine methyltransferase [Kineococcus sp. SYSU DK002]|uniref:DNA cytosine methyltransferase n=1 Tax=Kineococcus sp. SYSU DK002 TaxID=3383123 RepID=UPI003D7DFB53
MSALEAGQEKIIDLFAGPGGLDVAAQWLGVPVVGIEWDKNACKTRSEAGLTTEQGDVRKYGPSEGVNHHLWEDATILAGGPPCQTFTVAGGGAGRRVLEHILQLVKEMAADNDVSGALKALDDDRTGLVLEPLRWALKAHKEGRPYKAIVLEQVPAVLPIWDATGEALASIGYKVAAGVLKAEEFGVPQTRRRAVLVAHLERQPCLPKRTHKQYRTRSSRDLGNIQGTFDEDLLDCVSMEDSLKIATPFFVVSNYGTGGDPKARGRRRHDEPAATVTGKILRNRIVDESGVEIRRFDSSEAGQLQTFPLDFPWSGKDIAQQIGNAIPPRLGYHILAEALGVAVDKDKLNSLVSGSWEHQRSAALERRS